MGTELSNSFFQSNKKKKNKKLKTKGKLKGD